MKITLFAVNSSYVHTNLAVLCIKNEIKSLCECEVIEGTIKDRKSSFIKQLYSSDADVYGFSCYIWNITLMHEIAATLKKLRPDRKVVFGGPEMNTADDGFLKSHPYIDCVIVGEGEEAFLKISGGEIRPEGIIHSEISSSFEKSSILYDYRPNGRIVYYESSRGCPFNCKYCLSGENGRVRAKDSTLVLEDMLKFQNLSEDIKVVKFVDRTFNFDRERAKCIWKALLDEKYRLSYHFEIVASLLDEESFEILGKFPKGKIQLEIGVQSTNPETLKAVCRRDDSKKCIEAAGRLYSMGNMHIHCDLIAGLPYENYERFKKSFDDLYGNCNMLQLGFLKVLKGSAMEKEASSYGIVYSDEPPYEVLYTYDMTYAELYKLHRIDDLLSRIENEKGLLHTVFYLRQLFESPFDYYEKYCEFLTEKYNDANYLVQNMSQRDLYENTYIYSLKYFKSINAEMLKSCLAADFSENEKKTVPVFLRK